MSAENALADALLAELPLSDDGTAHVSDCGFTDQHPDCRCITLRGRLVAAVLAAGYACPDAADAHDRRLRAESLREAAQRVDDESERGGGLYSGDCTERLHAWADDQEAAQ